ncbi:MAG: rod shape-determining protein MreC [Syntrophomonadaceae bacterium]|nr:rod shape-determining protein MreC [Syntrophomonadaceae bacterium]
MFKYFRRKGFWTILAAISALLALMQLSSHQRPELTVLERLVQRGLFPLQNGADKIQQGSLATLARLMGGSDVQEQIAALESEIDRLNLENMQLRESQAEVDRLRSLLVYKEYHGAEFELQVARVVARSPNNWYQTLTIDKGALQGIAADMPVINPYGLVGKVVSVTASSAQIWLITDREMALGAVLQETRETRGIVEGIGDNANLRIINIPYYSRVKEGEIVVSSGLSEIYPPGIQIGIIRDIRKDSNGLVLSATVEPSVNFDQLEEVMVITQYHGQAVKGSGGV